MANIFKLARDVMKARRSGGSISSSEAFPILEEGGFVKTPEEVFDFTFVPTEFMEDVSELEMWDGYTVSEYGEDFMTVVKIAGTYGAGVLLSDSSLDDIGEIVQGVNDIREHELFNDDESVEGSLDPSSRSDRFNPLLLAFGIPFIVLFL